MIYKDLISDLNFIKTKYKKKYANLRWKRVKMERKKKRDRNVYVGVAC